MTKKKKIILFASIAGCAVLLGVIAALIFTSLGTGSVFRKGGSCAGKRDIGTEAEPTPTDGSQILVVSSDDPETTPDGLQPEGTPDPDALQTEEPTPTPDPYEELLSEADKSMMKDTVNILLVGVDYAPERESWTFKDFHSDVMIVLAVNFKENRADLISLPRDTYAKIPDVKGIYKLNASLNCGGGLYNDDGTFNPKGMEKVCEAAEWMIGDVLPVDYYYAVTMTSLKQLVDLCGGLEYDMDVSFHIQGRSYQKGLQHIDGQAFLDYCRVRKPGSGLPASEQGDAKRVNRQKRILIALFKQMKADRLITKIPDIVDTFDGELFTNCTFAQTASLAAFAYNLDPENINMYSMGGDLRTLLHWNFCFTDQANRVSIIEKVYGQKVKQYGQYTLNYARYRWCDMLYTHYKTLLDPLTKYVQKQIDDDPILPDESPSPSQSTEPTEGTTTPATGDTTPAPTDPPTAPPVDTPKPTEPPKDTPAPTDPPADPDDTGSSIGEGESMSRGTTRKSAPKDTARYTAADRELFEQYKTCVKELDSLHSSADREAKKFRNGKSNSLNSVGQQYQKKLAEVQALAIELAKTFNYTKVKNFTVACAPDATSNGSAWAFAYWNMKKYNEIRVDFN